MKQLGKHNKACVAGDIFRANNKAKFWRRSFVARVIWHSASMKPPATQATNDTVHEKHTMETKNYKIYIHIPYRLNCA